MQINEDGGKKEGEEKDEKEEKDGFQFPDGRQEEIPPAWASSAPWIYPDLCSDQAGITPDMKIPEPRGWVLFMLL